MSDEPKSEFADYRPPLTNEQFKRLQKPLERMAGKLARCYNSRQDLVQEANLKLWRFTNWQNPFVCAWSAMLDYLKHERHDAAPKYFAMGDGEGELNFPEGNQDVLDILIGADMLSLEGLDVSEREREWARLHFIEGMTYPEIHALTEAPQTSFFNGLNRVREAFRQKWLTEEEE